MIQAKHLQMIDLFAENGLSDDYQVQATMWSDDGKPNSRFMVFKPASGGNVSLSHEQFVEVVVISKQGFAELDKLDADVMSIINFISDYEYDDCIGRLMINGGMPTPTSTSDQRVVYRIMIVCLYGTQ